MRPPTNQVDDHGHNHDGADPAHHHHPHPVATPTTQTASQAVNQAVTEAANIGAGEGAVLLDIGDGAGALILYTGPDMLGTEIEISPVGQDDRRTHVAVLARPGQDPPLHAAVYPTLNTGNWNLWNPATGETAATVTIKDGAITEARWPTRASRGGIAPDRTTTRQLQHPRHSH